jgi:3-oxoadipate enol-lactonase
MSELSRVDAGGIRLAYRTWGARSAPPLVLLHALGEDGGDWENVAPT